jgi:tRNA dimethylallyltransferase
MYKVPDKNELVVILGPTASGKTNLATGLAAQTNGAIISADSRQVYRGMDVGTGKDLNEYIIDGKSIPYYLIDIVNAGEKYNLARFQADFWEAKKEIESKQELPILCGGTGLYIQSVLSDFWQTQVPENPELRKALRELTKEELVKISESKTQKINLDTSTVKRLIRGIEIQTFLENNAINEMPFNAMKYKIFGLNPEVELRRSRISKRLNERLEKQGMIAEVEGLLAQGISAEDLIYYGLEYKYITLFLTKVMDYEAMCIKLETEIHRYAKRQMTFFRSLEKKGFEIDWIPDHLTTEQKIKYVIEKL